MFKLSLAILASLSLGCSRIRDDGRADSTASVAAATPFVGGPIQGQYIVSLRPRGRAAAAAAEVRQVTAIADQLTNSIGGQRIGAVFTAALRGFVVQISDTTLLGRLRADPRVAYVEQNRRARADAVPVERQLSSPWGLDHIDSLGTDSAYVYSRTGANIDVYIFDTWINFTHDDFTRRADVWWNAVAPQSMRACSGHGTHVAGIIGGYTYGVAKDVRLHAANVLDCYGDGDWGYIVGVLNQLALQQLSTPNRRTIIANISIEGDAPMQSVDEAIAGAMIADILVVTAAGNSNIDACKQTSAHSPLAIRVGASTNSDDRWSFSNWGECVDIFGPGVEIESAWSDGPRGHNALTGTSMAAPHVAGAAAKILGELSVSADSLRKLVLADVGLSISDPRGIRGYLIRTPY